MHRHRELIFACKQLFDKMHEFNVKWGLKLQYLLQILCTFVGAFVIFNFLCFHPPVVSRLNRISSQRRLCLVCGPDYLYGHVTHHSVLINTSGLEGEDVRRWATPHRTCRAGESERT